MAQGPADLSAIGVTADPRRAGRDRWSALVVVCAAALIINIDNTILNVALPTLVRELRATSGELQWIVDSYAMVFAGLLLVGGSLADRFGRRRLFLIGLVVFAAGSVGAALCGDVTWLIAWRALMGAGAALTIPASLSILNDVYREPTVRARAISAWAGTIGLGIALGPIVGGLLLERFWWGSIFLVNVPVVVAGLVGAALRVPGSKSSTPRPADPVGAVLSIAGLGLLLWAIIEAPLGGWTSARVAGAGLGAVAVLAVFACWEGRSGHPLLPLGLFGDRRFSVAAGAEILGAFGLLGALFLQTQFLQFDLGCSPLQAGLCILPLAGVLIACAASSGPAVRALGVKVTAAVGLVAIAGGLWQVSAVSSVVTTYLDVLPGMLLIGLGAGLLLPTATSSLVGSVPHDDSGIGSAANAVALQVGGALGVAVLGSVLSARYQALLSPALTALPLPDALMRASQGSLGGALGVADGVGGGVGTALAHAARSAFMSGSGLAMAVGAGAAAGGAVLVLALLSGGSRGRHRGVGSVPGVAGEAFQSR